MCLERITKREDEMPRQRYGIKAVLRHDSSAEYTAMYRQLYDNCSGPGQGWSIWPHHPTIVTESSDELYRAGVHSWLDIKHTPWPVFTSFDWDCIAHGRGAIIVAVFVKLTGPICEGYEYERLPSNSLRLGIYAYKIPVVVYEHMKILRELKHFPEYYRKWQATKPYPFALVGEDWT